MTPTARRLFAPLFDGPIDIVGDVHGELRALQDLLATLGYDERGRHRSRRLVFIGDLCDRGHDSPGTIDFVRELVAAEKAQCLLGNHELNVLRGVAKDGNGWFFDVDHDREAGRYAGSTPIDPARRAGVVEFFASLPLTLERSDLRLVHAAWDDAAIALLRECAGPTLDLYRGYAARANDLVRDSGIAARAAAEWDAHGARLRDPEVEPPLLEHLARMDALYQMANPLRILTSGPESPAQRPFFAGGKWRMLDRVPWWQRYRHHSPVLVGHYWRWPAESVRLALSRGGPDPFAGLPLNHWHGSAGRVFCLDFAVGARHRERARGVQSGFATRLGAVRWPERELVLDDGHRMPLA